MRGNLELVAGQVLVARGEPRQAADDLLDAVDETTPEQPGAALLAEGA